MTGTAQAADRNLVRATSSEARKIELNAADRELVKQLRSQEVTAAIQQELSELKVKLGIQREIRHQHAVDMARHIEEQQQMIERETEMEERRQQILGIQQNPFYHPSGASVFFDFTKPKLPFGLLAVGEGFQMEFEAKGPAGKQMVWKVNVDSFLELPALGLPPTPITNEHPACGTYCMTLVFRLHPMPDYSPRCLFALLSGVS